MNVNINVCQIYDLTLTRFRPSYPDSVCLHIRSINLALRDEGQWQSFSEMANVSALYIMQSI